MPIQAVQKFIYRNLVQRPAVNRALDSFGHRLNRILAGLGIQKRYATGLTRNKAILFASTDPTAVKEARTKLWSSGRARAEWAVYDQMVGRSFLERFSHFCFTVRPGEEPGTILGLGLNGAMTGHPDLNKAIEKLIQIKAEDPQRIIKAALGAKFSPEEILDIINSVIINKNKHYEMYGDYYKRLALDKLAEYFEVAGVPFTPEQTITLLREMLARPEKQIPCLGICIMDLSYFLKGMKLNPRHKFELALKAITTPDIHLHCALTGMPKAQLLLDFNVPAERIVGLYSKIMEIPNLCYDEFESLPAFLRAGLSDEEVLCLFRLAVKNNLDSYPTSNVEALSALLNKITELYPPDKIYSLCHNLLNQGGNEAIFSLQALPAFINKAKAIYTPEQIFDFIMGAANRSGANMSYVFQFFPRALRAGERYLSPDIMADLFWGTAVIADRFAGQAFNALPHSLAEELPPEQILGYFGKIVEKAVDDKYLSPWAFLSVPAAVKAGMLPEELFDLVNIIDLKFDRHLEPLVALPSALQAGYVPAAIIKLYDDIAVFRPDRTDKVFHALCGSLRAEIPSERILEYFGQISKGEWPYREPAYLAVPAALKAGLSASELVDLPRKIEMILDRKDLWPEVTKLIGAKMPLDLIFYFCGKIKKYENEFDLHKVINMSLSLISCLSFHDIHAVRRALDKYFLMLERLKYINYAEIIMEFFSTLSQELGPYIGHDNFLPHLNLYMDIVINRKRMCPNLLHGIVTSTVNGIIPKVLEPEEVYRINHFIDLTHSFSPVLYKIYCEKGETALTELKALAKKLIRDNLGAEELAQLAAPYREQDKSEEMLFGIVQMAIPLSGGTFIDPEDSPKLFQTVLNCGDLREHIPAALQGLSLPLALSSYKRAIKEKEALDLKAINNILTALNSAERAEATELSAVLDSYLRSRRDEPAKENVRQVLYRSIPNPNLNTITDYYALNMLESLVSNDYLLSSKLVEALKAFPPELLANGKKRDLADPEWLVSQLNSMWQGGLPLKEKIDRLAYMTARYRMSDLGLIAGSKELNPEIAAALNSRKVEDSQVHASPQKLAEQILAAPLALIRQEKAKYELKRIENGIELSLQMVKGIPYGIWGQCAGVCIVEDIELWKDPCFKLIAMIDEEIEQAVGFIEVYEIELRGRKAWALTGIDPSIEFTNLIDPAELLDKSVAQIIKMADLAGIAGVYIATFKTTEGEEMIASNRSEVVKAIEAKNYTKINLPKTINWSRDPAYPFSEVYVVWKAE